MSEWKETEIGLIPKDWELVKFDDEIEIKKGQVNPNKNPYADMLHIGSENITPNSGRLLELKTNKELRISSGNYHFTEEDILYSKIRPYFNKVSLPLFEGTCSADIYPVRPKNSSFDKFFLFYYLLSEFFLIQAISFQARTGIPKINREEIGKTILIKPPIEEQKRIAAVLSCLDAKIDNLRRQNKTLEKIAQTLFKHWFIDFEFPNEEGKPYKSSGGAMSPSELGDIPAGWKVGKLGDIANVLTGYPFKSELYSFHNGIRVVRGENISCGFLRWDIEKKWEHDLDLYKDYFLQSNDYVIGMDGSRVGKNRTIIHESDLPLILAQRVARLRALKSSYQSYINILLMNSRLEKYVDLVKTGTSIPHISGQQIKDFQCLVPKEEVLQSFNDFYFNWAKKNSINKKQIQTLTKTRDALLPKLMSGEIRIKE